jgi:flagella basal body P-ring formation protein FlgA
MFRPLVIAALLVLAAAPAWAVQSVELRPDAAAHQGRVTLEDLFEGGGQQVLAAGVQPGGQVVLDAGRVQAIAAAHGLSWTNAEGLARIIVRADAASGAEQAAAPRQASVLVYARDMLAGEVVQPEDLMWSKNPAFGVPLDAAREPQSVIGQAARRPLRAGAAVSLGDIAAAQVIKRDDIVQVIFEAEGIRLVLQGKALGAAGLGQSVSVLNPVSKKTIEAVASGPGQAVVGPEAERLKVLARTNPKVLASLR